MRRGRFAPSPTGPLHFGSLVAALGSYLNVRAQQGQWLVRMEDLDPPREEPGAADQILRVLDALGFEWDGDVVYQSQRYDLYHDAIRDLTAKGLTYYCTCSRQDISRAGLPGIEGNRYPGTCRTAAHRNLDASTRLVTDDIPIIFTDLLQGQQSQRLQSDVGDFVILRRDGFMAYQIAVVVDDTDQGITEVVRGSDLLDSTPRQIYLQRLLDLATPHYLHLPVAVDGQGNKLSKQTGAPAIDIRNGPKVIFEALAFLGQCPPAELSGAKPAELLEWGKQHWNAAMIPPLKSIPFGA
ncbi:MAG: glutamyl-Q tRNA(Asp) ligase [Acidithiobacillales bacterium SG8_45]|jgi:glutamyl-Q tRNA(Asp) synthetase|nr:MAG: glutamyl-Q tRNA(Asp) ligase [Acidithiobacillales bacterium SG8_45]